MRVVQLIDSLDVGGGERMAVNLANLFGAKEVPNLLFATRKGGGLQTLLKNQSNVVVLSKSGTLDVFTFLRLLRSIKSFRPSVIHAHDSSIFWAVAIKLLTPGILLVWHAHYGGFSSQDARFGKKIKYLQRFIDRVIVVNSHLLNWVHAELSGIPKAAYIGNFPDRISEAKFDREHLKWIISVANLKTPKNHQGLVLAFSRFNKKKPGYKLALIGTKEDPQYLQEVETLIASESLTEEVKLVGSTVDLKPWFDKARMGVLSSHIEGLPVSLLELGLSGVPVISSEVGACGSLLEGGHCGYLVAPGSVDQLTSAMASLVDHPQETKSKAILFEQKVRDEFGGNKFFKAYKTLIKLKE